MFGATEHYGTCSQFYGKKSRLLQQLQRETNSTRVRPNLEKIVKKVLEIEKGM